MVISLIYMAPFLAVEHARERAMAEIVCHGLVRLAMKLVVAQFCGVKDHEIINEDAECVQSENAMQSLHHHQLATSLPLHSQSLGK